MRLMVNGEPRTTDDASTVAALIRSVGLDPRWVIVEINGEPLRRADYDDRTLAEGDRLELVRAVAGG